MLNEQKRKSRRLVFAITLIFILSSILGGCAKKEAPMTAGSGPMAPQATSSEAAFGNSVSDSKTEGGGGTTSVTFTDKQKSESANTVQPDFGGHKIIQSGSVVMETLDFDKTVNELYNYVLSVNGFIQNEDVQGNGYMGAKNHELRSGNYTFRIPTDRFGAFFQKVPSFGYVRSQSRHGEDITDQYSDTETRLTTLKIRNERLQSLMKKATKLADIIQLEKEIQEVTYEIDSLTGSLKKWDSLVSFATISVVVKEVEEPTIDSPTKKAGFGEQLLFALKDSLKGFVEVIQGFVIGLAYLWPYLLILAVGGLFGVREWRKRRSKKKAFVSEALPEEIPSEKMD